MQCRKKSLSRRKTRKYYVTDYSQKHHTSDVSKTSTRLQTDFSSQSSNHGLPRYRSLDNFFEIRSAHSILEKQNVAKTKLFVEKQ